MASGTRSHSEWTAACNISEQILRGSSLRARTIELMRCFVSKAMSTVQESGCTSHSFLPVRQVLRPAWWNLWHFSIDYLPIRGNAWSLCRHQLLLRFRADLVTMAFTAKLPPGPLGRGATQLNLACYVASRACPNDVKNRTISPISIRNVSGKSVELTDIVSTTWMAHQLVLLPCLPGKRTHPSNLAGLPFQRLGHQPKVTLAAAKAAFGSKAVARAPTARTPAVIAGSKTAACAPTRTAEARAAAATAHAIQSLSQSSRCCR